MSKSAAQEIDAQGGPAAFARKINVPAGTVRVWKHRDYFPRTAWPEISLAFPDLTLERLMAIEKRSSAT